MHGIWDGERLHDLPGGFPEPAIAPANIDEAKAILKELGIVTSL